MGRLSDLVNVLGMTFGLALITICGSAGLLIWGL